MLHVIAPPASKALDYETDVVKHIRVDTEDQRADVEGRLIPAVVALAQQETNLSLITRTLRLTLDAFPLDGERLELPRPPLRTVTHVKYYDENGTQQTWAMSEYDVFGLIADYPPPDDDAPNPGQIYPKYDKVWPTTRCHPNAVEIQWTAGYGAAHGAVPPLLKAGMLLMLGELFERREESTVGAAVTPNAVRARDIFRKFRVPKYREGWAA